MENKLIKPTVKQLSDFCCENYDDDDVVDFDYTDYRKIDNSWRHGCYISEVFRRISDDTYWMVNYQVSTDSETHTLRDEEINEDDIVRAQPYTITSYKVWKK